MVKHFMELAFSDSVRNVQEKYGTRAPYQKMEEKNAFRNQLTWQEKGFIQNRDGFYIATVGENGWPYMQYRGGPKGFLKVIDENTLGFPDFRGNGQYISSGNLNANNKTVLFMMDYANQQRLKIWAETDVLHAADHPDWVEKLKVSDYAAIIERVFIFNVQAFDWNCPQHIVPRYTKEEIKNKAVPMDYEPMETH
jgi:uncharacterized protein